MRFSKSAPVLAAVLSLAAVGVWAGATAPTASIDDDKYTSRGEGTFKVGHDQPIHLASARIDIDDHDRFTCVVTAKDKSTFEFKGRVSGSGHHRTLSVHRGLGKDNLQGSGELSTFDNSHRIESLTLRGDVENDTYKVQFTGTRPDRGDPDNDNRHSFSDNVSGSGRLDIGDEKMRITHLRVNMARNGDLHLVAEGPDHDVDREWEGRWSGSGPVFTVELHPPGKSGAHVRGEITLSRNGRAFKKVEIQGKERGEDVRMYFEAN